ncbi:MAG: hypothetical protein H8D69_01880 [Chloroflexi bacterium]|nr:hypothetical protein [Chloroflexota bacterium]
MHPIKLHDMRFNKPSRIIVSLIVLTAALATVCSSDQPPASEIVSNSLEHAAAVESYTVKSSFYLTPESEEVTQSEYAQIQRPNKFQILDVDGTPRFLIDGESSFRRSDTQQGKWTRYVSENPVNLDTLSSQLPDRFVDLELVEYENGVYVVDGFGIDEPLNEDAMNRAIRYTLKILASDFALIEMTRWDFPSATINAQGEIETPEDGTLVSCKHINPRARDCIILHICSNLTSVSPSTFQLPNCSLFM